MALCGPRWCLSCSPGSWHLMRWSMQVVVRSGQSFRQALSQSKLSHVMLLNGRFSSFLGLLEDMSRQFPFDFRKGNCLAVKNFPVCCCFLTAGFWSRRTAIHSIYAEYSIKPIKTCIVISAKSTFHRIQLIWHCNHWVILLDYAVENLERRKKLEEMLKPSALGQAHGGVCWSKWLNEDGERKSKRQSQQTTLLQCLAFPNVPGSSVQRQHQIPN